MKKDPCGGLVEGLRNLVLGLERLVASEAATGAVRGAAEGLRDELPKLDAQLRALLLDALVVLGRLVHEAAEREHLEPGAATRSMAVAGMQGALEVLEREWKDGGLPLRGFVERLNRLLDEAVELAHSRTDEIRSPMARAEALSRGMVRAAVDELREGAPALAEQGRRLVPHGAEIARNAGQGFIEGIEARFREDGDSLDRLLERSGRALARGLAAGVSEALASRPAVLGDALTASVEALVERSSAAAMRGAARALAGYARSLLVPVGAGGAVLVLSLLAARGRRGRSSKK